MLKEQIYSKLNSFHVKQLKEFLPFPKFEDRKEWEELDFQIKDIINKNAKQYENFQYPLLSATDFMAYFRNGSRTAYEDKYFQRRHALNTLILDYCIVPTSEKLDQIINGIWCICEESSWVVSAHNFIYEPEEINEERTLHDITLPMLDIFSGETGMLLSLCFYLLKDELDKVEPLVCRRIQAEIKRRIITPFLTRYDYWWMGYSSRRDINNWGPWCVINCLICVLFCEQDDDLRKRSIVRAMDMMDYYLEGISIDGGCDEGATYWGRACGMLLEGLNLVYYATDGKISIYHEEKLINFTDYIRKMYIGKDYVVNFADGSARCNPAAEIIYTSGCYMNNKMIRDFGAYCYKYQLQRGIFPYLSLSRALASIKKSKEMLSEADFAEFELDQYIDSLEIMVARQYSNVDKGFFLCAKGGNNNDSHNHNDVGNIVCYFNGYPILIDVGVGVYSKESFGENRYDIWTMQSGYHNLPDINGISQKNGEEFRAMNTKHYFNGKISIFECEIQGAYPNIDDDEIIKRRISLDRVLGKIDLIDTCQINGNSDMIFHFMTPCDVSISQEMGGIIFSNYEINVIMKINIEIYDIDIETIELNDSKLQTSWGNRIHRIKLKNNIKEKEYHFTICNLE